jgi:FAD/FMN-containing dehydrogenase
MGMLGSNGGLVGVRRVPTAVAASGVWTPNEQSIARQNSLWPAATYTARHWRFDQFTTSGEILEISEFVLAFNGSYVSGGTWSASGGGLTSFTAANMADSVLSVRAVQMAPAPSAADFLQYDHGSPASCTGFRYASQSANSSSRWITGCRVQTSPDATNWIPIKIFSGLANPSVATSTIRPELLFSSAA